MLLLSVEPNILLGAWAAGWGLQECLLCLRPSKSSIINPHTDTQKGCYFSAFGEGVVDTGLKQVDMLANLSRQAAHGTMGA